MEKVIWMDWPWNLAWKSFLVSTRKALFILHSKAWEVSTRNPGICWWLAWEFCSLKATSKFNLSHFSLCYKHSPSPIGAWNWIQYFSQHVAEWTEKSGELGEEAPGKILTDSRKTKAWSCSACSLPLGSGPPALRSSVKDKCGKENLPWEPDESAHSFPQDKVFLKIQSCVLNNSGQFVIWKVGNSYHLDCCYWSYPDTDIRCCHEYERHQWTLIPLTFQSLCWLILLNKMLRSMDWSLNWVTTVGPM